jgi:hypothetical protein
MTVVEDGVAMLRGTGEDVIQHDDVEVDEASASS